MPPLCAMPRFEISVLRFPLSLDLFSIRLVLRSVAIPVFFTYPCVVLVLQCSAQFMLPYPNR